MELPRAEPITSRSRAEQDRSSSALYVNQEDVPVATSPITHAFNGRPAHIGIGAFAVPAAVWFVSPRFGLAIIAAETAVLTAIFLTALYGSDRYSKRAFRLLRWAFNRSEPPTVGKCLPMLRYRGVRERWLRRPIAAYLSSQPLTVRLSMAAPVQQTGCNGT
jgi:hypothetical protein